MNNKTTTGITFIDLLGLLFIALKLMGVIDWDWWVVLIPVWLPLVMLLVLATLYVIAVRNNW